METYIDPNSSTDPQTQYNIIDMKKGDVTGDGIEDEVYLLGIQSSGDSGPNFFNDITVNIIDGKTKQSTYLRFRYNSGSNPKLLLEDFTGDGTKEIFISIATSTSPGGHYYYIFSAKNNVIKSLFNFMEFNSFNEYKVIFDDFYQVRVIGLRSGKEFIIDISGKDAAYLANFYNQNGKLKAPVLGKVLPLGDLFPVDLNNDNVLELIALQRIVGESSTDVLGYIQTFLNFDGNTFVPSLIFAAITGKDVPTLPQNIPSPTS